MIKLPTDTSAHRNDPGIYSVTHFSAMGRKETHIIVDGDAVELTTLYTNLTDAIEAAEEWKRLIDGNSAVVHRCLYNTRKPR